MIGSIRPEAVGRGYVSISADGAPVDRVEWPVFGEQLSTLSPQSKLLSGALRRLP